MCQYRLAFDILLQTKPVKFFMYLLLCMCVPCVKMKKCIHSGQGLKSVFSAYVDWHQLLHHQWLIHHLLGYPTIFIRVNKAAFISIPGVYSLLLRCFSQHLAARVVILQVINLVCGIFNLLLVQSLAVLREYISLFSVGLQNKQSSRCLGLAFSSQTIAAQLMLIRNSRLLHNGISSTSREESQSQQHDCNFCF